MEQQKVDLDALEAALARYGDYTPLDIKFALPALLAEVRELRRLTTPEPIGEKHRDGNWWLVWGGDMDKWVIAHHDELMWQWYRDCGLSVNPTHALPLPPAPEARP